jgi:hypothetical protein
MPALLNIYKFLLCNHYCAPTGRFKFIFPATGFTRGYQYFAPTEQGAFFLQLCSSADLEEPKVYKRTTAPLLLHMEKKMDDEVC